MRKTDTSALGIIFPNTFDQVVPELTAERLMASIPFGGRYRMIDFILSSMVNSGIDNISVLVNENYFSLLDHLGSGREWDLVRKHGGINIFPPFFQKSFGVYGGRVDALDGLLGYLRAQKEKYVVMTDSNIVYNIDFTKIIEAHIESGADVTALYTKEEVPYSARKREDDSKGLYYTFNIGEDNVINKIIINTKDEGIQNYDMNVYVMDRKLLIDKVAECYFKGGHYFERDILLPAVNDLKIVGLEYTGYVGRISNMLSYFNENMKLLDDANLDALFDAPVFTKVRDDNPTRYIAGAQANNALVADGCVIEGTVENSILFRGVKVGKGAVVKNCILMQDTVIEEGAEVEYLITDKKVTVSAGKSFKGADTYPAYIPKKHVV